MPWNITSPNTARIGVNFVQGEDSYTPSSAWIVLTYLVNNVSNSSTITLETSGGRWVQDWSSVGVDVPQNVNFTVMNSCSTNPAETGIIRIIDP